MRQRRVAAARGDAPADLVLKGGEVLSVFTGEVFPADVAVLDGRIVGVGPYEGPREYDVTGKVLVPGFIDGHCHIESSKLSVEEFARVVLPRGTTSVVVDPHELANVLGVAGVQYVLEASEGLPLGVYVKVPSCVPASPYESPFQNLEASDLAGLFDHPRVIGLAEMMNFPAAIAAEPGVMGKMALTRFSGIDGHAPGVRGRELNAYLVAGPSSDHECTELAEALEKKRLGMWVMIREASMIRNLRTLLPLVRDFGTENCMFVTDDREAGTLLSEGHINSMVRTAMSDGLSPGDAVKLASLNVARYHGLEGRGAIAPGYWADIAVVPDLRAMEPVAVFKEGRLVASEGEALPFEPRPTSVQPTGTVRIKTVSAQDFRIPGEGRQRVRVVELVLDQVVTKAGLAELEGKDGALAADPAQDLAKLAVLERHHATGRVGLGFVRGFGLREGAFASTVAHDAHNVVVAGIDDLCMARCVERLTELGGGLVAVRHGQVIGELPLEIAGLMSQRPAAEVARALDELEDILAGMGVQVRTPFMYLGFLALSVIPELRLTDRGLVDVRAFQVVPLALS